MSLRKWNNWRSGSHQLRDSGVISSRSAMFTAKLLDLILSDDEVTRPLIVARSQGQLGRETCRPCGLKKWRRDIHRFEAEIPFRIPIVAPRAREDAHSDLGAHTPAFRRYGEF
jgi:hypothetical protein